MQERKFFADVHNEQLYGRTRTLDFGDTLCPGVIRQMLPQLRSAVVGTYHGPPSCSTSRGAWDPPGRAA